MASLGLRCLVSPCINYLLQGFYVDLFPQFPLQMYIACGTQADQPEHNKVMLLKLSELHKTKYDGVEDKEG